MKARLIIMLLVTSGLWYQAIGQEYHRGEVEANGQNLGEIQKKLLEKIEELTLYTINQQKTIETLLQRIEKLEKDEN